MKISHIRKVKSHPGTFPKKVVLKPRTEIIFRKFIRLKCFGSISKAVNPIIITKMPDVKLRDVWIRKQETWGFWNILPPLKIILRPVFNPVIRICIWIITCRKNCFQISNKFICIWNTNRMWKHNIIVTADMKSSFIF